MTEEHKKKISQALKGKNTWSKGKIIPLEIRQKISLGMKGVNIWTKGSTWSKKNLEERKKKARTLMLGNKRFSPKKGNEHHSWIKDRTQLKETREKAYDTKYKYWMLAIKKRDKWICRIADVNCDGRLEAHHILNWADYPELRYEVNNGITLCHAHHPRGRENEAKLSPFLKQLVAEI